MKKTKIKINQKSISKFQKLALTKRAQQKIKGGARWQIINGG